MTFQQPFFGKVSPVGWKPVGGVPVGYVGARAAARSGTSRLPVTRNRPSTARHQPSFASIEPSG